MHACWFSSVPVNLFKNFLPCPLAGPQGNCGISKARRETKQTTSNFDGVLGFSGQLLYIQLASRVLQVSVGFAGVIALG